MRLFGKKSDKISNRLELLSVHIPKTAGTSFRNILKQVYGEDGVIRLDIGLQKQELRINEATFTRSRLPRQVRVAHGHFSPALLLQRFEIDPEVPFITWLRDPVERVISNYFYLSRRLAEELDEAGKNLNILSKMQRSLLEYARADLNRNRMSKFLEGMELEDFRFVGIQDDFPQELKRVSRLLDWPEVEELHHNKTGRRDDRVSEAERREIESLNEADMALYEKALRLRDRQSI